jgi:hypothetical protein
MGDKPVRDRLRGCHTGTKLLRAYSRGFQGVYSDPKEREKFLDTMNYTVGMDASHDNGWADDSKGKLVIPFKNIDMLYPGAQPGAAQGRGDCVSHSTINAAELTMCCDIVSGEPDEETGKIEGPPEVSPEGVKAGLCSSEAVYWWRGHGGDGWSCAHAGRVICQESGIWLRQNYPEFGFDLTGYSSRLAGKWGRSEPPGSIKNFGLKHRIRQATELDSFDEVRDFLYQGYGISTCGGEGWSSTRDANGFSKRRGGWSHALAYVGADDRDIIKEKYGEPLVLIMNSWGVWNSGPRRILGTTIDIPKGSYWSRWSDCKRRYMVAFSGADGWPARKLPDWGADYWSRVART